MHVQTQLQIPKITTLQTQIIMFQLHILKITTSETQILSFNFKSLHLQVSTDKTYDQTVAWEMGIEASKPN